MSVLQIADDLASPEELMTAAVVDLFAAGGGWDEGLRQIGITDVVGIEWDRDACATAVAAGHRRIQADVARIATDRLVQKMRVLIGSPPCTKFTAAGNGMGRLFMALLADGIRDMFRGEDRRQEIRDVVFPACLEAEQAKNTKRPDARKWSREKLEEAARIEAYAIVLVLEPARFIVDSLGAGDLLESVLLEQVKEVMPLWHVYKLCLARRGWSVWTGVLNSADYGVPQTRERAILVARRHGVARPPAPTHTKRPEPALFGVDLLPWVSMAEALGWPADVEVVSNYSDGSSGERAVRRGSEPASTVTSKSGSVKVLLKATPQANATVRGLDEPAPTILCSRAGNLSWVHERLATTVQGDPRIAAPGRRDRAGGERQHENSTRVSIEEASILQSFPADYPWQGNKGSQFLQCGNAVPPRLAAAVATAAIGASTLAVAA